MTKKEKEALIIEELMAQSGKVKCQECSSTLWAMYHEPDKCPKNKKSIEEENGKN